MWNDKIFFDIKLLLNSTKKLSYRIAFAYLNGNSNKKIFYFIYKELGFYTKRKIHLMSQSNHTCQHETKRRNPRKKTRKHENVI